MALSSSEFDFVRQLVYREAAIVLQPGKEYLVETRLTPLAREAGAADVNAYISALIRRPDTTQQAKVVDALTTNETSWFRDGSPFEALTSTVLPELQSGLAAHQPIRIWSAACSTGQEPYTLSMLLGEKLAGTGRRVDILATDISDTALERAKSGRYRQLEVNRGLPAPMLVKHFHREGNDWAVNEELRARVKFQKFNLISSAPPSTGFDVVFLRNVLIYFDTATKQAVLRKIRSALKPGGWLFLGAAETTIGIDDEWERVAVGRASLHRSRKPDSPAVPAARTKPATAGVAYARTPIGKV
jgi:chemotaxis protein methyltransferase CheR